MAMMEAIEQEYADELLVTTTLIKEAFRIYNITYGEVSDYMNNRGLHLDKDGNVVLKEYRNESDLEKNR